MASENIKLSPTSLNLYAECKRCFWLKMNKGIKRPSGPFPSLPSGVDEKLKQHFDSFRKRGEKPPELVESKVQANLLQDQEFLDNCRSWRREPKYKDPKTGALLRGGVDELLRAEDDSIIVLDYKTRGYSPKEETPDYYSRQINFYNLILRENGNQTKDYGYLLYYYPDEILENGNFVFHDQIKEVEVNVEKAKQTLREAVRILEDSIPDHSEDCDYCDWRLAEDEF